MAERDAHESMATPKGEDAGRGARGAGPERGYYTITCTTQHSAAQW